jgi:hypothetical protein
VGFSNRAALAAIEAMLPPCARTPPTQGAPTADETVARGVHTLPLAMHDATLLRRTDGLLQIRPPLRRRVALAVDPALEVIAALVLCTGLYVTDLVPVRVMCALAALCLAHVLWRAGAARALLRRPPAAVAPLPRAWRRRAG